MGKNKNGKIYVKRVRMVYNELEWYEYLIRINCIFEKLKMHKHVCETKSNINEMYCEMKQ